MRVAVCGDSFMSRDPSAPGKHFSELLSSEFGVTNYAYPGVSNIDICYQIKEAIIAGNDYVIIGTTDSGRTEMPLNDHIVDDIRLTHLRPGPGRKYISDTIPTLVGSEPDLKDKHTPYLTVHHKLAAKMYMMYMFNSQIKMDTDMWAIHYWLDMLTKNNIQYKLLSKDFCIYTAAIEQGNRVPWVFHTEFDIQAQAAQILNGELKLES